MTFILAKNAENNDHYEEECEAVVLSAIGKHIEICQPGSKQKQPAEVSNLWHLAVHGAKADDDISDDQKERIRYKCRYLLIALTKARNEMGRSKNRPHYIQNKESQSDIQAIQHRGECE